MVKNWAEMLIFGQNGYEMVRNGQFMVKTGQKWSVFAKKKSEMVRCPIFDENRHNVY